MFLTIALFLNQKSIGETDIYLYFTDKVQFLFQLVFLPASGQFNFI